MSTENNKTNTFKIIIFSLLAIFFLIGKFFPNSEELSKESNDSNDSNSSSIDTTINTSNDLEENWLYGESEKDKMDNSSFKFAEIESINTEELEFPYNGGTKLKLLLRKGFRNNGNEVILIVNKGQFKSNFNEEEIVRIKFDSQKPISYGFNNENSGETKTIFLHNPNSIIKNLKTSKNVIIEVEFYSDGLKQFEFNVDNLKW
jgi:hypothetical protein